MRNSILRDKAEQERQRFIDSLDVEDICRLASSYHGGDPCKTFRPHTHGSFNLCYFVQFDKPKLERWVVRISLPTRMAWVDEKLDIELATMKYVAAKTTITVPRVHAYSFTESSPVKSAFVIMDYVEGQTLQELGLKARGKWDMSTFEGPTEITRRIYEQLADLYIQLRGLEFPRIGALGLPKVDGKPSYNCKPDDIKVIHRPLSIEMALQQFEEMDPGAKITPGMTFSSSRSFTENALLWLADNDLNKSPDLGMDERGGRNILYARHHFRQFVLDKWLDSSADKGPFVLMHGDITQHINNLLFDKDVNLVGVIDWEWSYVVPAQLLVPPVWLTRSSFDWMIVGMGFYNDEMRHLLAIIKDREAALQAPPRLSLEWAKMESWCHTAVAVALQNPDAIYTVYWDFLFYELEVPKPESDDFKEFYLKSIAPRLTAFMESPERAALLERKKQEQVKFFEEEKEYFDYEFAGQLLKE